MQNVEVVRLFDTAPEDLWAVYTDHAGWSRWAGFQKSYLEKKGSPDPNGTGAVRVLGSSGVDAVEEVLDFEPPRRMTYRIVRGALPMKNHLGEVCLEPDGNGTRLVWRCRFESKIFGLGWLLQGIVTTFFRRALAGLDRHLARTT